jgi:DNA-binding CsgD family transcriptional regulator
MENKITDLKKENAGLKEKLAYLKEILDKAPCFIYINEIEKTGKEYTMRNVYLNKYAIDITGYSMEEAYELGFEYFRKVLHPDDFEVSIQSIEHLAKIADDQVFGGMYRCKPKDMDYIWQIGRSRVFKRSPDGSPKQFLNSTITLNEEIHTHNQMIELLKENSRLLNENIILKLTKRERDVLKLLAEGNSAKMISEKLNVEESTICSHRKNMLRKLNMENTASLVNFAAENGLN